MSKQSSSAPARAPSFTRVRLAAALSVAALAAACATTERPGPAQPPSPPPPPSGTEVQTREGVTPPHMQGRQIVRVGLLLPFSLRPQDASALYNAAELALFDHGNQNTLLIPRDAGADETSARAAAQALVQDGADIIIGPVLREGVEGAGQAARADHIPVIGFSSDRSVGGDGVYLLSFQLEDEVHRLVTYAATQNIRSLALLAPDNEYGRRVEAALRAEAQARGVTIVAAQLYNRTDSEASAAATALATQLRSNPAQGILIAESGSALRSIGSALVRGGVDQRQVRFMGTSAWGTDAMREPTLAGGWFVSPDPSVRADFEQRYQQTYGAAPTRLASLSYDAVALAASLSRQNGARGLSRGAIENDEGFAGSDGLFRFHSDGAVERGMAILEVRPNQVVPIDPAPRRFPAARS